MAFVGGGGAPVHAIATTYESANMAFEEAYPARIQLQ